MSTEAAPLSDAELQKLYAWVDGIPLSRQKRSITRDFSDGVLVAEIVKHYAPSLVDLHNYTAANSVQQKNYNWTTLNSKVFRRIGFAVMKSEIDLVCRCRPNAVERVLRSLRMKIEKFLEKGELRQRQIPLSAQAGAADGGGGVGGGGGGVGGGGGARRQPQPEEQAQRPPPPQQQQQQQQRGQRAPQQQPGAPQLHAMRPPESQQQRAMDWQPPQVAPGSLAPSGGGGGSGGGEFSSQLQAQRSELDRLSLQRDVDTEILIEKEQTIQEMRETVEILELKIKKLEQLVRIKDSKIATAMSEVIPR